MAIRQYFISTFEFKRPYRRLYIALSVAKFVKHIHVIMTQCSICADSPSSMLPAPIANHIEVSF